MARITIARALHMMSLLACLLALTQTESCAARICRIRSLDFMGNGSQVAVNRYDARTWHRRVSSVSRVPMFADVSQTVSVLDARDGSTADMVAMRMRPKLAVSVWRSNWLPSDVTAVGDRLLVHAQGTAQLFPPHQKGQSLTQLLNSATRTFGVSPDKSTLITLNDRELSAFSLAHMQPLWKQSAGQSLDNIFPVRMAVSSDGRHFAIASVEEIVLGEHSAGLKLRKVAVPGWITDVCILHGSTTLVITTRDSMEFRDMGSAHPPVTLKFDLQSSISCTAITSDGKTIALGLDHEVQILRPSQLSCQTIELAETPTAVCFSDDGRLLAVGDDRGQVRLYDCDTLARKWKTTTVGRRRPTWIWPACIFILLCLGFPRVWRRPATATAPGSTD